MMSFCVFPFPSCVSLSVLLLPLIYFLFSWSSPPLYSKHSRYYSQASAFHRLLTLLSNEMVGKVRDIVGENPLADPLTVRERERERERERW